MRLRTPPTPDQASTQHAEAEEEGGARFGDGRYFPALNSERAETSKPCTVEYEPKVEIPVAVGVVAEDASKASTTSL